MWLYFYGKTLTSYNRKQKIRRLDVPWYIFPLEVSEIKIHRFGLTYPKSRV